MLHSVGQNAKYYFLVQVCLAACFSIVLNILNIIQPYPNMIEGKERFLRANATDMHVLLGKNTQINIQRDKHAVNKWALSLGQGRVELETWKRVFKYVKLSETIAIPIMLGGTCCPSHFVPFEIWVELLLDGDLSHPFLMVAPLV